MGEEDTAMAQQETAIITTALYENNIYKSL